MKLTRSNIDGNHTSAHFEQTSDQCKADSIGATSDESDLLDSSKV
jgi:hypothetical protein